MSVQPHASRAGLKGNLVLHSHRLQTSTVSLCITHNIVAFLSKVIKQEGLSKDNAECTLFDLLKYNDIDDDERLTKEEFYTAFGELTDLFPM